MEVPAMHWRWRLFGLLVSVLAAVPLVGLADDSATDVAGNWRLLRRWKEDPEHYARLQRSGRRSTLCLPSVRSACGSWTVTCTRPMP